MLGKARWVLNLLNCPWRTWFIALLLVPNVVGAALGFLWYRNQLSITPRWLWFFTADCPVYGLLFALILILWLMKREFPEWLLLIAATGLIKYGVWFTLVVGYNWINTGELDIINALLAIPHLGMAIQGAVFLRQRCYSPLATVANFIWLLLNDVLDYGLGIYPWIINAADALAIRNFTVLLSGILAGGIMIWSLANRFKAGEEEKRRCLST